MNRCADEHAIRALVDRQATAWAGGNPEAYADVFTEDADYVTFLGSHYKGRDAIAASYVWLFKRVLKGTHLKFESVRTDGRWLLAASQNTKHRRFMERLMGRFDSPKQR